MPLMVILFVCLAGALVACGTQEEPPEENPSTTASTYTIVFDSTGGGAVSDKTWTEGTTLSLPTPSAGSSIDMYGYSFVGWYYDAECTKAVDRTSFDVSYAQDGVITLYAAWSNVHYLYFDTKTSETIEPMQFAYNTKISVADLPQPSARMVGSTTCRFVYWIQTNTGSAVTEDFVMDAQDMYFYAYYDIGTNIRFELDDDGYYNPTGTESATTQSRYYDYTLQDGQVYSVDMTLPADWSTYSDDSGPVFAALKFNETGTTFNNGHYIVMFISRQTNYNGAIEFWGTADVNGKATDLSCIARYTLDGSVLKDTPYYEKMKAYQASDEAETFTFTYRRVDNEDNSITWYVGIDGVEYIRLTTGQAPYPKADAGNLIVSTALVDTDDDGNIASLVGLRAKTLNVKYSNISVTDYSGVEITFDAGNGTLSGDTTRVYAYGTGITLPTPVYSGYEFAGWYYYTDYAAGTTQELSDGTEFDNTVWKIYAIAQWRKEGALPYTVVFETGAEGYTLPSVTGWYEGNKVTAPALEAYLGSAYLYIYTGSWYYDAACTKEADLANLDPAQAVVEGEGTDSQTLTLYAGSEKLAALAGEGTQEKPYLIQSASDLTTLGRMVELGYSFDGNYLQVTTDITLTGEFTPIGSSSKPFSGTFDGNGKKITGLTVNSEAGYAAMFGYTSNATVKNLELTVDVTGGKTYTAGLIAYSAGTTLVENCTLRGSVTGTDSVGGFIGSCYNTTTVRGCTNYATVTATGTAGATIAGGIIGGTTNVVTVDSCVNYGTVSSQGGMVGGVVGILRSDAGALITRSVNFGNVSGSAAIGGIVGVSRGTVSYCFCASSVTISNAAASTLEEVGYRTGVVTSGPNGYIIGQLDTKAAPATSKEPVSCGLCDEEGNITYTLDYGYEADGSEYTQTQTSEIGAALPVAQREGYTFDGWYLNQELFTEAYTTETLTAKWTKQVTITFDANGGTFAQEGTDSKTFSEGEAVGTLPELNERDGYTLLGWFTEEDESVTAQSVFTESVTVTAKWEQQKQYATVTFDADGGSFATESDSTRTVETNTALGTLPTVTKNGYAVSGWYYTAANGEEEEADENTIITRSVTVTVRWRLTSLTGSGTQSDPYVISDSDQLVFFAASVNNGEATYNASGVYVAVTANIDMASVKFTSIASTEANAFVGIFEGNNHSITNIDSTSKGLFGYLQGGTIQNVKIQIKIIGANAVGGIVGAANGGTISGCETLSGSTISGTNNVAGIVGYIKLASVVIENCVNRADVTGTDTTTLIGGIVGSAEASSAPVTITRCENYGNISGTSFVGGIAGLLRPTNAASANGSITDCYNYGNVTSSTNAITTGGIVGCSRIKDVSNNYCYSEALINGEKASALTAEGGKTGNYIIGQIDANNGGTSSTDCGLCDENGDPYSAE